MGVAAGMALAATRTFEGFPANVGAVYQSQVATAATTSGESALLIRVATGWERQTDCEQRVAAEWDQEQDMVSNAYAVAAALATCECSDWCTQLERAHGRSQEAS